MSPDDGPRDPGDDRLRRLLDLEQIRDLPRRYALAFDRRDPAGLQALWEPTEERVRYPAMNLQTVIRDFPLAWERDGQTMLFVANHVVDFDPADADRATGVVYCVAQLHDATGFVEQSLTYEDEYVRIDDAWRFRTRRHLLWFGRPIDPDPLTQPDARWPRNQVGRGVLYDGTPDQP